MKLIWDKRTGSPDGVNVYPDAGAKEGWTMKALSGCMVPQAVSLEECRDMLYRCPTCHAMVWGDGEAHAEWHEKFRRAVDEAESLG